MSLAEYVNIHKQHPEDPFAAFCVALGYVHLACQKFISNKNSIVMQVNVKCAHNSPLLLILLCLRKL